MTNNTLYERPTNVTSTTEFFFEYPNEVLLPGMWGYMILTMVFMISFLSMVKFGVRRPFAASSFLVFVASVFLVPLGALGGEAVTLTAVLVVIAVLLNRDTGRSV